MSDLGLFLVGLALYLIIDWIRKASRSSKRSVTKHLAFVLHVISLCSPNIYFSELGSQHELT